MNSSLAPATCCSKAFLPAASKRLRLWHQLSTAARPPCCTAKQCPEPIKVSQAAGRAVNTQAAQQQPTNTYDWTPDGPTSSRPVMQLEHLQAQLGASCSGVNQADLPSTISSLAASTPQLSPAAMSHLEVLTAPLLNPSPPQPSSSSQLPASSPPAARSDVEQQAGQLVQLAVAMSQLASNSNLKPSKAWLASLMQAAARQLPAMQPQHLSDLAWALSALGAVPDGQWLGQYCREVRGKLQDFSAPHLCRLASGMGGLEGAAAAVAVAGADPAFLPALLAEARFQLAEFTNDFTATDLALLLSGLADLNAELPPDMQPVVMKAVYLLPHTIEDKAALDFALAKMDSDKKSLLYDPRWTHEELHWLPRHERDKRRIINQEWQRTQWGGWA